MHGYASAGSSVFDTNQPRHKRGAGGRTPLVNFLTPLEKCVGYDFKILDIVQKIWVPLRKLFAPPGVTNWLRA